MARTAVGALTIADISDGFNPIAAVLGNQSHAFAAGTDGTIPSGELDVFGCEVFVFVGETRCEYDALLSVNNTYKIVSRDATTTWTSGLETILDGSGNDQAVIKCASAPSGTTDKTGVCTVVLDVKNSIGNITRVTLDITWSKVIEGSGGAIISLSPSRQTFKFNAADETSDIDIVIPVTTQGNVGALSAKYSINGDNVWNTLNQGTLANQGKTVDVDGAGGNDQIVISAANFNDADIFGVRVEGVQGQDTVSIIRIQDGADGPAALTVYITSDTGGATFKNNQGATKTLECFVRDNVDGTLINTGVTYTWFRDGVSFGTPTKTITVTASDVDDNGSNQFTCLVNVT